VVVYFCGGASVLRFRARNMRLDAAVCGDLLVLGLPPFVMQLAAGVLQSILNHQLGVFGGDLAISVMGILYAIVMIVAMPIFGITQGAQPIIGYNYGAKRFDRVKQTLQMAILAATGLTVLGFGVLMLFPAQVIRMFNGEDEALLALGIHAIRVSTLMLPIIGCQIVGASYFQAVGKPKEAIFLTLSRQVLLLIPAALILPRFFGLDGVWAALPTSDFGAFLLTGICLLTELRRLDAQYTIPL
jgi:Na+-driven multidrug efflux pump